MSDAQCMLVSYTDVIFFVAIISTLRLTQCCRHDVNKATSAHARGRGQHCTGAIRDMIHFCYYNATSVCGIYIDMLFTLK